MRLLKIDDDEEIELYVIKQIDDKKFRIPVQVDEDAQLKKNQIPDGIIMVRSYSGGNHRYFKALWNKEYEFKKRDYLETAKSLDKLISKLKEKEYGCYVFNWENGKRLL